MPLGWNTAIELIVRITTARDATFDFGKTPKYRDRNASEFLAGRSPIFGSARPVDTGLPQLRLHSQSEGVPARQSEMAIGRERWRSPPRWARFFEVSVRPPRRWRGSTWTQVSEFSRRRSRRPDSVLGAIACGVASHRRSPRVRRGWFSGQGPEAESVWQSFGIHSPHTGEFWTRSRLLFRTQRAPAAKFGWFQLSTVQSLKKRSLTCSRIFGMTNQA